MSKVKKKPEPQQANPEDVLRRMLTAAPKPITKPAKPKKKK